MALVPRRHPLNLIRVMPAKGRKTMPEYIRVLWKHDSPDEPIEMHYEVLTDRTVPRMVEIFLDGRAQADRLDWHAARYPSFVGSSLVSGDMDSADQIRATVNEDTPGEFEVFDSTQHEFEAAFAKATPLIGTKGEKQ
jgi:hypothetical protein